MRVILTSGTLPKEMYKQKQQTTNLRTTAHIHRSDNMEDSALPPVNDSSQAALGTESASGSDFPATAAAYGAWGAPGSLGYELGCSTARLLIPMRTAANDIIWGAGAGYMGPPH